MSTNHAEQNAAAWAESIEAYIVAMDQDSWDRLEELGEETAFDKEPTAYHAELEELATLKKQLAEFEDADQAREQAEESALEITLTGSWAPCSTPEADGYIILLSTGGPALRISGDLGRHSEPSSARLEYQDWGTGWTEYRGIDGDSLLSFASIFYFGE